MSNTLVQAVLVGSFLCASTWARDVTFPPVNGYQMPFSGSSAENPYNGIDVSSANFGGLTTYANLPYVHCLSEDEAKGVTARPGARFGPTGIRLGSRRISPKFAYSIYTGENIFQKWAKIIDCGDSPLTVLDNTIALKQLDLSHKIISSRRTNSTSYSVPRILTLGGDHTTTLSALRSAHDRWGKVSVIHFDSHLDTWDPEVLGGGISHYAGVNHGTFLHIAAEEGLIHNSSIHAGIRAPVVNKKYDLRHDKACGFSIVTARDLDRIGISGVVERLKQRVHGTRVYISVDIDVLDPAYAPATGTAEVGGWTTRELLTILDALEGLEVVGADVVEVAPIYDNAGEATGLAAAEVVHSLLALMVNKPVKP
ncbi:Arginase [Elsinoe australis]|uniref:Arginase n=1 Tax=Elsinoe australis TaxID=40998 RepID=A0A2P7YN77_9PEZI|nr:Arginase [Elsinoe australis]